MSQDAFTVKVMKVVKAGIGRNFPAIPLHVLHGLHGLIARPNPASITYYGFTMKVMKDMKSEKEGSQIRAARKERTVLSAAAS